MAKQLDWKEVAASTIRLTPNLFGVGFDLSSLVRTLQGAPDDLEAKVQRATSAMHEASGVVEELQLSIEAEVGRINSLKEEYERYKGLAAIEEEQAKALMQQLDKSLTRGRGRERLVALAINIIAGLVIFVLGVWLSPFVRELFGVAG